jgi:cellulose synthase/poly-beta-1,6-N-acetylglucosamine synthase-like glycosyltransferase
MPIVDALSVLICTYNRAPLLRQTLAAVSSAHAPEDCAVEIVVIDNNSSDETATVVERAAQASRWPVRYASERRQGKSYALNHGLGLARGDVIALTDDDVLPADDWLERIVDDFRAEDVVFVCGKVVPRWEIAPPPELLTGRAHAIWGPLALVDYGDEPVRYEAASFGKQRFPIGANLAVRREALERIGGWRNDLGKIDNTLIAGEDHDLCVRLHEAGLSAGLYDPAVVVRHFVPASRLRRDYFRRWFFWHGRTMARMAQGLYLDVDLSHVPHVAGVPRFVYRQCLAQIFRWLRHAGRRDALALLIEELKLLEFVGFLTESWRRHRYAVPKGMRPHRNAALRHSVE